MIIRRAPWLALALMGCSILLPQGQQCHSDSDCPLLSYACVQGLCVTRDAGRTTDGGITDNTVAWVMSYSLGFHDLPSDSLHLAFSDDGVVWTPLADGRPAMTVSGIGSNHIRDPFVFRRNDGTFVLLATDFTLAHDDANYWNNPSSRIFVADSSDLITFTNGRLLPVTNLPGPASAEMHAWSPEAFYDSQRGEYGIAWAGNDTTDTNRIYVSYVDDSFTTVRNATPEVLFDPGYSVVNPTIVESNGARFLFFRDATASGNEIQIARSMSGSLAAGSFTRWSGAYITSGGAQAPFVVSTPRAWYLYSGFVDTAQDFGAWSTLDLNIDPSHWQSVSAQDFSLPRDAIQPGAVRLTQAEVDALVAHYGRGYHGSLIRTTAMEGGASDYIVQAFYAVMAPLGVTDSGIRPEDYRWHVQPGLSDATDSALVSFESATRPGFFWRIHSASPNDWPSAAGPHYRDAALSMGSTSRFNHLVFLERNDGSATFAADATFRRVPAINGNAMMASFAWSVDPTLVVGCFDQHLVAQTQSVHGSVDVMSFAIED